MRLVPHLTRRTILMMLASLSITNAQMTPEEVSKMNGLENEIVRVEQKIWGLEVRIMHVERLMFNNHPVGMTPGNGNNALMPLRSPGAIVRRNETLRRRGLSSRGESSQSERRNTPETEPDSYFNLTPHH